MRMSREQPRAELRIFKNKWFVRFADKESISNERLIQAVEDAENGKIDANYGGGVIKQRIARPKEGKSGGYRTIILYRKGSFVFFVFGFAKSEMDNIDKADVKDFKKLAKIYFDYSEEQLNILLKKGDIEEVSYEKE